MPGVSEITPEMIAIPFHHNGSPPPVHGVGRPFVETFNRVEERMGKRLNPPRTPAGTGFAAP